MRAVRNYGIRCERSVGRNRSACSDGRRYAKDLVAIGRTDTGLCDAARRSDNRAGSRGRTTHASRNRIRLCPGRRFRAAYSRPAHAHLQSRRWLANTAGHAACRRQTGRNKIENSRHLRCGERKAAGIAGVSFHQVHAVARFFGRSTARGGVGLLDCSRRSYPAFLPLPLNLRPERDRFAARQRNERR